jgi:hypothetical protein
VALPVEVMALPVEVMALPAEVEAQRPARGKEQGDKCGNSGFS